MPPRIGRKLVWVIRTRPCVCLTATVTLPFVEHSRQGWGSQLPGDPEGGWEAKDGCSVDLGKRREARPPKRRSPEKSKMGKEGASPSQRLNLLWRHWFWERHPLLCSIFVYKARFPGKTFMSKDRKDPTTKQPSPPARGSTSIVFDTIFTLLR